MLSLRKAVYIIQHHVRLHSSLSCLLQDAGWQHSTLCCQNQAKGPVSKPWWSAQNFRGFKSGPEV